MNAAYRYSQALRIRHICCGTRDYLQKPKELKHFSLNLGYNENDAQQQIDRMKGLNRDVVLLSKKRTNVPLEQVPLIPYMSKFSRRTIFVDCYFQTFHGNNCRGSRVSSIRHSKIHELNFRGLLGIRENRENYAPRKFGRIS